MIAYDELTELQDARNKLLGQAEFLIQTKGWHLGSGKGIFGNLCAIAALVTASLQTNGGNSRDDWESPLGQAIASVRHAIPLVDPEMAETPVDEICIPNWNDDLPWFGGRKRVVAAFRKAAELPLIFREPKPKPGETATAVLSDMKV